MMTCPPHERLLAHVEGLDSDADRAELKGHLRDCRSCRDELAILVAVTRALRNTSALGPPDMACSESDELLAYADGRLDPVRASEFEAHLVHCGSCVAELADVWATREHDECDPSPETVALVMRRLAEDRRTLLVRISEKTLMAARTVAASIETLAGWSIVPDLPAAAAARSRRSIVHVLWREASDITVEYLVEWSSGAAELTGRIESEEGRAQAISVALSNDEGTRGPESPDAAGRFGPWRLAPGQNRISLSGAPIVGGLSHHGIAVDAVCD